MKAIGFAIIFIAVLAISFFSVAGIFYGICWAFHLTFWSWKASFGIWLAMILLSSIFGGGGHNA